MDLPILLPLSLITLGLILLGIWEFGRHRRVLSKIPVRIHVNGTRGKSSVTRLIAAGLRAGGKRVLAKTTGTLPRVITPDGREYPIYRSGLPTISEQVSIIKLAESHHAEVIVIECMALHPELQNLSEKKMLRSTHGVITNVRPDHLDIMGPTEKDVGLALCGTVPFGGRLYTAEEKYLDLFEKAAQDRNSPCISLTQQDKERVTEKELGGFSYIEHAENVALALKVCFDLGVARQTALAGMQKAAPDPGALQEYELDFFGREIEFVNGFAANDPQSTETIWNLSLKRHPEQAKKIALFNCRSDRPDRSAQLGRAFAAWTPADEMVLMGSGTYLLAREAVDAGFDAGKIHFADDQTVEKIFETLVNLSGSKSLIVGMGNSGGQGLEMVQYFANRSSIGIL